MKQQPRPLTGRAVLFCLLGFFGTVALANAILIRAAVSTFGGVETSSSYQGGLAFARNAAAARAQDDLHWQVKADVRPSGEAIVVEIDARDATGRPLTRLEASVMLHHPTDRRADQTVAVNEDAAGRFRGTGTRFAGQRDLLIELSRGGERLFRSQNRVILQ
jgi:nitrogen fixation protein FixH